jgi:RNA polymerase sigma-70 factor (ECF subfamily)
MLSISPDLTTQEAADLAAARDHDGVAFARLVAPHRAGLHAHCYRMLGSAQDAEDALQDALLRAWRGLARFERRSSLRTWLYTIATNVCLKLLARRPRRMLVAEYGPPADADTALAAPVTETVWLEPFADDTIEDGRASPEARYEQRESVELAFSAALQHLPARQRAVLLLRDVLGFAPAEIADALDATPASVYSMLQRAHETVDRRLPARSQQTTLRALGDRELRGIVDRYVRAWEDGDVGALTAMLTADATFAMPPRPSWYRGPEAIGAFLAAMPLSRPRWRVLPARANGQLAFGFYTEAGPGRHTAHALSLVALDEDGRIADVTTFHRPDLMARLGLPAELRRAAA